MIHQVHRVKRKATGLGDTLAGLFDAIGIGWLVKRVAPRCRCKARRDWLNRIFPYDTQN
jgi:hypothetical protein